jgi:hypothetical protein
MGFLNRLRRRLGWWLIKPTFLARYRDIDDRIEDDHQPVSYHKDWWLGQQMSLYHLAEDLRER